MCLNDQVIDHLSQNLKLHPIENLLKELNIDVLGILHTIYESKQFSNNNWHKIQMVC